MKEKKERITNFWHLKMREYGTKEKNVMVRLLSVLLSFVMVFGVVFELLLPCTVNAAENAPTIIKAQIINDRDIELYWSEEVTGADTPGSFQITVDGVKNDIRTVSDWEWNDQTNRWDWISSGIVYYNSRNSYYPNNPDQAKTSFTLKNGIASLKNKEVGDLNATLPKIEVKIAGNSIRNAAGTYMPEQTVIVDTYEPLYQQEAKLDCGVRVLGTKKVRPEAVTKAAEMLEVILANPEVAKRMGDAGCMLGIYGEGEIAYDIIEHRYSYDENYLYVEGFGGTQLASIKDANVLRLTGDGYRTGYPDESILAHEFGHTVQNFGLSEAQQKEFENIYETSTGNGKWANSYAGSNSSEYFATLTAIWFNAMDDTWDGNWDGVRGPINTREELKAYDPEAYSFMSKVYVSDQYLPAPWENGTVPDNFTYIDPNQPGPDTPDPDKPDPDKPGPEKPDPDKPDPEPVIKPFKVTFVYNNGQKNVTKSVKEGKKVSVPKTPKRSGYYFEGWYLNSKKFSFNTKITKNITLKAKWTQIKKPLISSIKTKSRKATVTFKLNNGSKVNGCKITYAKDKNFKKSVKSKTISSKKVKKWTTGKLSKGTYYFKIQAYRLNSQKAKVYGKASKIVKVTVK